VTQPLAPFLRYARFGASAIAIGFVLASTSSLTTRAAGAQGDTGTVLPNGWTLAPPRGLEAQTGTMPQGAALSPDGATIAVVESGVNPAALTFYSTRTLQRVRRVALSGAFGRPVWVNASVLVAGANADALFRVNAHSGAVRTVALGKKSYPVAVAYRDGVVAVSTDGDGAVRIAALDALPAARAVAVGKHPGNLAFADDGTHVFVALRASSAVARVATADGSVTRIATGLHPADVLVHAGRLYVAESDADAVGTYDAASGRRIASVDVSTPVDGVRRAGASPNALAMRGDRLFVSLGAANQIAEIAGRRVVARMDSGWYPTDVLPAAGYLYVVDGKGERMPANPYFDFRGKSNRGYIGAIELGSLRRIRISGERTVARGDFGPPEPSARPTRTVVRRGGPIRHVFFILKENRSYDQVLGDVPQGNGDARLTFFGARVTPNQHALALRFGLFDNAYAGGEVSDPGHNWADGAFANDYVERFWPPTYGGRRDDDDTTTGNGAEVPAHGFMWDAARAAHVSFRDYGEMGATAPDPPGPTAPGLRGLYDMRYMTWDLNYSDLDRFKEWKREFDAYVRAGTLPQLEYLWLPNDHTQGSRPGNLTPAAYVAQNDYAVGLIVQAISRSAVWRSSAVFIIEDDAQDGADHVSAQRTTMYIASPYARGGVQHAHYSTMSILHTIESILGMAPLSAYDAAAEPLYAAFGTTARLAPFAALAPRIDITARNARTAYAAAGSVAADFTRPDATAPGFLLDVLANDHGT
jgi:DNA-binding beta-propeller fold protein YncE